MGLRRKTEQRGETTYQEISEKGYRFQPAEDLPFLRALEKEAEEFRMSYNSMSLDPHLNPGEGKRTRRYARMGIDPRSLELFLFPHDTFFQSKTYDVLYGDIHRNFPPLAPEIVMNPFFQKLLQYDFSCFPIPANAPKEMYEISIHMIRIAATENGLGRPAPEGIHRDGYDYAAIHLMDRVNVSGAENRIHALDKRVIDRHTFHQPFEGCLFDDRKIFHSVRPFKAEDPAKEAYRDMLILLYQPLSLSPQRPATPVSVSRH